jgi:N-methylhydantoinase A
MLHRIAADIGGTFTDVALMGPDGKLSKVKVPSTPDDFARGVLYGCRRILSESGVCPGALADFLHASTVATNAILEGKGARTALVTTRGFRDVLELRRIRVPRLYEPLYCKPPPLVPRRFRFEVSERIGSRGEILQRLDEAEVEAVAEAIAAASIEAVAICFLNSYANFAHERSAGAILRKRLPNCFVTLSVDVLPEIREYERTSTTVINAYVAPSLRCYLRSLRQRLEGEGIVAPILMMQSSGGILDLDSVLEHPAQVVEGGPAAGVVGAGHVGRAAGYANIITLDIGGTTAKASVIENGRHLTTDEYEVGGGISLSGRLLRGGGYALKLPVIDICEVGAGGGSLVSVSRAGSIGVGPESAGSDPGPAAYGRGGTRPTVTDAHVVLGYINPTAIADGALAIDAAAARNAIDGHVAAPLAQAVEDAAFGIVGIANILMIRAIRTVTTLRGRDPGTFTLIAFGGAGGLHAVALAQSLGISRVVIPPGAGVFSALGLLFSDVEYAHAQAFLRPLAAVEATTVEAQFAALEAEVLRRLGRSAAEVRLRRRADLRYSGQAFELTVDVADGPFDAGALAGISAAFDAEHERTYGHSLPASRRELVAVRVSGTVRRAAQNLQPPQAASTSLSHYSERPAYFGPAGWWTTPVVGRDALAGGWRDGPLIVEEADSTTIVPPGSRVRLDRFGGILVAVGPEVAA